MVLGVRSAHGWAWKAFFINSGTHLFCSAPFTAVYSSSSPYLLHPYPHTHIPLPIPVSPSNQFDWRAGWEGACLAGILRYACSGQPSGRYMFEFTNVHAAYWFLVGEIHVLTGCMVFWPRMYLSFLVNAFLLPSLEDELELGVRQQQFRLNFQYF